MELHVDGEVIEWRGPAPHLLVPLSEADSAVLRSLPVLSYGWGCIPVLATIEGREFETSLMPKDGRYLLPLKVAVRRPLGIGVGDRVAATLLLHGP